MSSRLSHLECSRCGLIHNAHEVQQRCGCGGTLFVRYDLERLDLSSVRARPPGPWRYNELLPVLGDPVSLGEVETPLLFMPRLSERLGTETWVKDEGPLPGGTFKERGASVALSRAVELGVKRIVMNTAGNAGGTWSLYAARAGLEISVVMARTAPAANQAEVRIAGGDLELVDGTIADAGRRAVEISEETGAFLAMTFFEPYRLEGKKTAFLEIFDRLGDEHSMTMPRTMVMPVGGGVAAIAASKVADEVRVAGWSGDEPPRIVGVQPANCAPIVRAFEAGVSEVRAWESDPMTIAAGLRVPAPVEGTLVLEHVRASRGSMVAVSEDAIRAAIGDLASEEGVFACPEGAATLAAAYSLAERDELEGPVVLYNTGAGSKYIDVLS